MTMGPIVRTNYRRQSQAHGGIEWTRFMKFSLDDTSGEYYTEISGIWTGVVAMSVYWFKWWQIPCTGQFPVHLSLSLHQGSVIYLRGAWWSFDAGSDAELGGASADMCSTWIFIEPMIMSL